ncbi:MAG TPA: tetratricopeptide repeat protein [Tepidisphaeraceae bacterium]|nr:tetratricopeptide repeat protein [Tepidisphaeraceae bacterium]
MATVSSPSRLSKLWQFPLLLVSMVLFGIAAFLFIDPKPGPTIDQKIEVAQRLLKQEQPDAALDQLNRILTSDKLDAPHEGNVRLMIARALEMGQQQLKLTIPANYRRIIEQTRLAMARGIKLDAVAFRRLGDSYEALNRPADAIENYRKAIGLDPKHSLSLLRKVINVQLDDDDLGPAQVSLEEYLARKDLSELERSWALGQEAQLLIDQGKFIDARILLDQALRLANDPVAQGEVNYRLGYCAYKLNDSNEAERFLRVAREQLQIGHPLDADASYLLGKISQDKGDPATANSFYQIVLTSHIDSKVMPLALMGRALGRITLRQEEAGLSDLHDLVNEIQRKTTRAKLRPQVITGLRQASALLAARENFQGALEVLAEEELLDSAPSATFFERLGAVYENRADQIEKTLATTTSAERAKRTVQVREMRTHAGDAYIAYSQKLTLTDDNGYGEAMWHGIDLYDHAAAVQYVISALELFTSERPDDKLAPDATLRLGRAYQAAGLFDKAIAMFQRIQFRYPQSLARSKSAVPLAQAYVAKGPENYGKAESVLLSVINDNPRLDPEAEEFRQALFDLAQLYYRTSRFEEAVTKLEEFVQRYPNDDHIGQLLFLMGDSYRKSAALLDARLASARITPQADPTLPAASASLSDLAEVSTARKTRLNKAKELYDQVVDRYRAQPPSTDVDKLYFKLSHFYRADCLFDLEQYADAVKLYDAAAFRYQEDPSALAAYVQIVNAYCAMGKFDEARTANERAKWLLRRMPPDSFNDGTFSMPKAYWEQWLQWTSTSGMW